MSVFKAILRINSTTEISEVVELVKKWINKSPYSELDFANEKNTNDYIIENDNERIEFIHLNSELGEHFGAQYIKKDKDCEWRTEIVCLKRTSEDFRVSVVSQRLDYTVGIKSPVPFRPYIIKLLMENTGSMYDDGVLLEMTPKLIDSSNVQDIIDVINGRKDTMLPIVYVSKPFFDEKNVVDVKDLAKWLSGFAHVYYEQDTSFTDFIRKETDGQNPYNGTIGIYWPNSNGGCSRYVPYHSQRTSEHHINKIRNFVQSKLASRKIDEVLQWSYLVRMRARQKITKYELNLKTYEELKEFLDLVLRDNEELKERVDKLEEKNDILENRVTELEWFAQTSDFQNDFTSNNGIINCGNEVELYKAEQYELLLEIIKEKRDNLNTPQRIKDILTSILTNNPQSTNKEKYLDQVKRILIKGQLNSQDRKELKKLGIELSEDGKHFKLKTLGDDRYSLTIAKTPSDNRAGLNNVSNFKSKIIGF